MRSVRKKVFDPRKFHLNQAELRPLKLQPEDIVVVSYERTDRKAKDSDFLSNFLSKRVTKRIADFMYQKFRLGRTFQQKRAANEYRELISKRDSDAFQKEFEDFFDKQAEIHNKLVNMRFTLRVSHLKTIARYAKRKGYPDWQSCLLKECEGIGKKSIDELERFIDQYQINLYRRGY